MSLANAEFESGINPADVDGESISFKFLPKALTERSRQLVETYHGLHGYSNLADVLWHAETRDFISLHRDLAPVFRKASIARSAKRANQGFVLIAATLLSLEVLANDFAGWGRRFPWARRKADALIRDHLPNSRTWLIDFYLYRWRWHPDRVLLETISPPPDPTAPHAVTVAHALGSPAHAGTLSE